MSPRERRRGVRGTAGCSGDCSWAGRAAFCNPLSHRDLLALEPGDVVPVGRCPKCREFAYVAPGVNTAPASEREAKLRLAAALSELRALGNDERLKFHPRQGVRALSRMVREAAAEVAAAAR